MQAKLKQTSKDTEGSLMIKMKEELESVEKKHHLETDLDAKTALLVQVSDL